jgi:hypothetical protein
MERSFRNFTGAIVVVLAVFVQAANGQHAVKPSKTLAALKMVNFPKAVFNATLFPGADIGAEVNAAVAALPNGCGEVTIPEGSYNQTTTITLPRCVVLSGASALGTSLNWTPTSGTAILVADLMGTSLYPTGEVNNLSLNGSGNTNPTIAIFLGGGSTNPVSSPGAFGDNFSFRNVKVSSFGIGAQWGNHAWADTFYSVVFNGNGTAVSYPGTISDSGESIAFYSSSFINGTVGLNLIGYSDFFITGSRCDYNALCASIGGATQAHFYGVHFEQGGGSFINIGASPDTRLLVDVKGSTFAAGSSSGTDAAMISVTDPSAVSLSVNNSLILTNHAYTNFLFWNPSYYQDLTTNSVDLTGNTGFYHNSMITNAMSTPCNSGTGYFQTCITRRAVLSSKNSFPTVNPWSCITPDMVMPGYRVGDINVSLVKSTPQAGLIIQANQGGDDHPGIILCNVTGTSITPTLDDLYTMIIQR